MKKFRIALALVLMLQAGTVFAQRTITIRMASPVPENSPWGTFLNLIAEDWRTVTNGQVNVIIFHNRTAGSEEAVVRNLRLNQLQAAVLSTFGLTEVAHEVMTLSTPFFIRDDDELDIVMDQMKDVLEARISDKGFHTLAWTRVGWIKFFSKAPVFTPNDLKAMRLGTINEYESVNQAFRAMGFQMVPVAQNDLLIALNSPMVDAIYNSVVMVGSTQVFGLAKNMASINIAPMMGAMVFNRRAWNAIPDRYKDQMMEVVRIRQAELDVIVKEFEADLIRTMGNHGLAVNQLTPAQEQLWYDEGANIIPSLIGTLVDRDIYNRMNAILQQHRNRTE